MTAVPKGLWTWRTAAGGGLVRLAVGGKARGPWV